MVYARYPLVYRTIYPLADWAWGIQQWLAGLGLYTDYQPLGACCSSREPPIYTPTYQQSPITSEQILKIHFCVLHNSIFYAIQGTFISNPQLRKGSIHYTNYI